MRVLGHCGSAKTQSSGRKSRSSIWHIQLLTRNSSSRRSLHAAAPAPPGTDFMRYSHMARVRPALFELRNRNSSLMLLRLTVKATWALTSPHLR